MANPTLERIAHTAVGIPVHAVNALMERLSEARATLERTAEQLSQSTREDIDRWALEGEELVERMLRRIRHEIPERAETARDVVSGLAATATGPVNDVTEIPGVGDAYAERLRGEGVATIAAFLARTSDDGALHRLAAATGIAGARLATWRSRVDLTAIEGVDEAHEELLRRAGFASIASVAATTPEGISQRLQEQQPARMPSTDTIGGWVASARAIDR